MTNIDFSTSQTSISTFYEKKRNFTGFSGGDTCEDFSIDVSIATFGLIKTKLESVKIQVKIHIRPFLKRKSNFRFSCCRTREELSIHESITTVGLILAKLPEPEIEVVECFNMCKAVMERRGLKVNNGKMKILVSGRECDS